MNKHRILHLINLLLPGGCVFFVAFIAFSNFLMDMASMGLIVFSLLLFYPIIFFLQGITTALLKSNLFIAVGISTFSFIIVIIVWLNSSANGYIVIYLIASFIGYGVTRFVQRRNSAPQK